MASARRYQRIALPKGMLVAWEAGDKRTVSRVATLGLGGLFIPTPAPPPVGEVVRLVFQLPGGEVRARALVRTSDIGKGMGVAFTWMNQESRAKLNQLLKRLLQ
jgi:hypothetical protein